MGSGQRWTYIMGYTGRNYHDHTDLNLLRQSLTNQQGSLTMKSVLELKEANFGVPGMLHDWMKNRWAHKRTRQMRRCHKSQCNCQTYYVKVKAPT
jgi:hypothetical protein